jgi:hypothetical protein
MSILILKDGVEVVGASVPVGVASVTSAATGQLSLAHQVSLDNAGVVVGEEIVPARAGSYGAFLIESIWCDTARTLVLTFNDEDGFAINPTNMTPIGLSATISASRIPYYFQVPILVYGVADNKALEVGITGGAIFPVPNSLVVLYGKYWYE